MVIEVTELVAKEEEGVIAVAGEAAVAEEVVATIVKEVAVAAIVSKRTIDALRIYTPFSPSTLQHYSSP
jgi:hypothetical protein